MVVLFSFTHFLRHSPLVVIIMKCLRNLSCALMFLTQERSQPTSIMSFVSCTHARMEGQEGNLPTDLRQRMWCMENWALDLKLGRNRCLQSSIPHLLTWATSPWGKTGRTNYRSSIMVVQAHYKLEGWPRLLCEIARQLRRIVTRDPHPNLPTRRVDSASFPFLWIKILKRSNRVSTKHCTTCTVVYSIQCMANPTMYGFGAGDRMKKLNRAKRFRNSIL